MNSLLLKSIKLEYENSPLSIEDICKKHKITKDQLTESSSWVKEKLPEVNLDTSEDTKTPIVVVEEEEDKEEKLGTELRESINKTAKILLNEIQNTIVANSGDFEPKEFKDLASALNAVKESVIGKEPSVVVQVQNNNVVYNQLKNIITSTSDDC